MRINRHDTNGTKPLLSKGELGYDDYTAGGDAGRVYVGTGTENIALAEKLEANIMTKAQFNALAEERKANRAGSGFDNFGYTRINHDGINEGMSTGNNVAGLVSNEFYLGNGITNFKPTTQKTNYPLININGSMLKITGVNSIGTNVINNITLPTAPNIYPYDTVLTAEQIASGVIKHADASNSGLIVNGKFDTDTSGWISRSSTLSINNNTLRVTVTGADGQGLQDIPTVAGKKYILEFENKGYTSTGYLWDIWNGEYLTKIAGVSIETKSKMIVEFTALGSITKVRFGHDGIAGDYADFDNIAVFPADAISRSDLVFLESWHEDVSEKNFVYPLGNVQYLGANTDGLTGIANGAFTGFETYSLFGNWQTPSALIGKGYVWSTLTEVQKKAFIANPDNNCYLDGDKVIQVRYRVRVVQGTGDVWLNTDSQSSSTTGYIHNGQTLGTFYVYPKGNKTNITSEFGTAISTFGVFSTKFGSWGASLPWGGDGVFSASLSNGSTTGFVTGSYNGQCFALPIALVHR